MKAHWRFFDALKGRRVTLKTLAAQAGVSRPHLSLVIKGTPGRGGQVRRKVAPLLTEAERQLLGWNEMGEVNPKSEGRNPKES
jgi:hypothetical protein